MARMRNVSIKRRGGALGAWATALVLIVTACAPRPDGPAPLISGESVVAAAEPSSIKVRPGQTLSGIAQEQRVPMRMLAEANRLYPPYRIEAGSTLIIPRAGQPPSSPSPRLVAAAMTPAPVGPAASSRIGATALERMPAPLASVEKPPIAADPPPATAAVPPPATEL